MATPKELKLKNKIINDQNILVKRTIIQYDNNLLHITFVQICPQEDQTLVTLQQKR